jgi:hypothetical protein
MRSWIVGALVVVAACGAQEEAAAYKAKSQATEAKLMLTRLSKDLKAYYAELGSFPVGKTGLTPAEPCCKNAGGKCAVSGNWAKDPAWSTLKFELSDPHYFQYSYESDGKFVSATAVGDLDCDGTTITFKLDVPEAIGERTMTISEPNLADD